MDTFAILVFDKNDAGSTDPGYVTASATKPEDLLKLTGHDEKISMHYLRPNPKEASLLMRQQRA